MAPIQRLFIDCLKVRKLCMDEINVPTFPGKKQAIYDIAF